jgi:glutamate---cysteine ligase / carboxylate-amine ligase
VSRSASQPSVPTFGVEEEFLLVDAVTGLPAERNLAVVEGARARGLDLALEFARCQVEIDTSVHTTTAGLRAELSSLRGIVAEAATQADARLLAVAAPPIGVAPFTLTDSARFERITDCFGSLTYGQVICGCHVHVGMQDRETALQVSNFVRPWLPVLLALTANSAVYGGFDTGYASWRAVLQSGWPVSGPPPYFRSVEHYERRVDALLDSGAALDEHMVYWDIRPSAHLPTLEIRVSDVPATVEETVTLATIIRALAITAVDELREGRTAPEIGPEILRAAKWKAAHDGLRGEGYDLSGGRITSARSVLESLLTWVTPALEELGELENVARSVHRRIIEGNGAIRQREALRSGNGIGAVIAAVGAATVQDAVSPASVSPV